MFPSAGLGRGDEGRDGDEVRLHGPHGDDPPQRGGHAELLRQIRRDHLQCVGGLGTHSHWLDVSIRLLPKGGSFFLL